MKVLYSKRSSKTGRALARALKNVGSNNIALRWGDSKTPDNYERILNCRDAVKTTVNKLAMLTTLKDAGVCVPEFSTNFDGIRKDASGHCYARDRRGVTHYINEALEGGAVYYTRPVPYKRREYRLHVFRGHIFAAYEKMPHDTTSRPALFKASNCKFRRVNINSSLISEDALNMCISAVSALGLDYGAVDLIRTQNGKRYVICEVNSSAGLNSVNIARLTEILRGEMI